MTEQNTTTATASAEKKTRELVSCDVKRGAEGLYLLYRRAADFDKLFSGLTETTSQSTGVKYRVMGENRTNETNTLGAELYDLLMCHRNLMGFTSDGGYHVLKDGAYNMGLIRIMSPADGGTMKIKLAPTSNEYLENWVKEFVTLHKQIYRNHIKKFSVKYVVMVEEVI